jgi:hypothetical protein
MKRLAILTLALWAGFCGAQVADLKQLMGKKVIVQRFPLYQPGTFNGIPLSYAGKTATVIAVKPSSAGMNFDASTLAKMPATSRATLENMKNMATITVQFEDGTKADTGGPVMPSMLDNYFELAPGETIGIVTPSKEANSSPQERRSGASAIDQLSEDEVKRAMNGQGRDHWIWLENLISVIRMPEAEIGRHAEFAKKQFSEYVPSEEDKQRAITIELGPGITCISQLYVTKMLLLSDKTGTVKEEPYLSEHRGSTGQNGFGAKSYCEDYVAKFSLASIHRVAAAAPNGEFIIAMFIDGSADPKFYTIKKKQQSKLGLLP